MGKIVVTNGTYTREFTCEQFALMGYDAGADWTVTENTCGIYTSMFRSPYASFGIELNGTAIPGTWYVYKATIAINKVTVPGSAFTLPSNANNVRVIVRRQEYHPTIPGDVRDFTVNNADNSIEFNAGLGLNGQIAFIKVFK